MITPEAIDELARKRYAAQSSEAPTFDALSEDLRSRYLAAARSTLAQREEGQKQIAYAEDLLIQAENIVKRANGMLVEADGMRVQSAQLKAQAEKLLEALAE